MYDVLHDLYHLHNLKNVKNTHGGVLLLVHFSIGLFHLFKIAQMVPNRGKLHLYIS